ncbi:MAG: T9SS type A sorting domain-containing protein, partial [Saprospiraceae bacterium]|nr:T9SS type A sorting domain-containing protein [Saprospiraceae bacterium]
LFSFRFKALRNMKLSDHLRISSKRTLAESYEGKGELKDLGLKFSDAQGQSVFADDQLLQNYPNPFTKSTIIGIQLHQGGRGHLRFYDLTGKQIKSIEKIWNAGYQEVLVDDLDFPAAGIYFYKFESAFFNASRKMILKL